MISLSRVNSHWEDGVNIGKGETRRTSLDTSSGMIEFTAAALTSPRPQLETSSEKSGNVIISVKPGSGIQITDNEAKKQCDNWFYPSYVKIDVGSTVSWVNEDGTDTHSITSANWITADKEPRFDYKKGELDNHIFMKGQKYTHTFDKEGTYQYGSIDHSWMKGVICVGAECSETDGELECPVGNGGEKVQPPEPLARFDKKGQWCISEAEAFAQMNATKGLKWERAPLCSNPNSDEEEAITIENVRAARSIMVNNVLAVINGLNDTAFVNDAAKGNLTGQLEEIRGHVLSDNMSDALSGYVNFADSVDVLVKSETGQQQILKVVNRNIVSTSHEVPEFETLAILVLVLSTITIIVLSRKISFNLINIKSA
jgi:predicted secreted protein with PEFG-CTERM motif